MHNLNKFDGMFDVVIVGAGTVGLTMANLLKNLDLKICLIEKNSQINQISNAVGVNDLCLNVWQKCGILEKISDYIAYNKNDEIILKYIDEKTKDKIFNIHQSLGIKGFAKGVVFLQNKIDETLLENLQQEITIIFDQEIKKIAQNNDGIFLKTQNKIYKTKYLIGADGKDSKVRELLNIKLKNLSTAKDEWLILNLLVKNLEAQNKFVEVFCGARSVVSCPLPLGFHRVELSLKKDENNFLQNEENIKEILKNYINFSQYQVIDKFKVRFKTAIAKKYFEGCVVLCGDAAHTTSPFASAGLVSGIEDCLELYKIFVEYENKIGQKIDFKIYQKARYSKQIKHLRLAILLENLMRPNFLIKNILFFMLKKVTKNAAIMQFLSIRKNNI